MKEIETKLHFIFFNNGKEWDGVCLDFSLCESGKTINEANKNLFKAVISYLKESRKERLKIEEIYCPAPEVLWKLIKKSIPIEVKSQSESKIPYMSFKSNKRFSQEELRFAV